MKLKLSKIFSQASSLGLHAVGAVDREQAEQSLRNGAVRLKLWQEHQYHGEMVYMGRSTSLFEGFQQILPEARSAVSFLFPYSRMTASEKECPLGFGRVARYAWGRDYHTVLRAKLTEFVHSFGSTIRFRVFSDSVPILERALAEEVGLGFIGRNSLLIRPGLGSYFFIAEVLWDVEIEPDMPSCSLDSPVTGCGSCRRCVPACPTDAIVADRVIDSRRCISYLTIEKRTPFSTQEAQMVGSWLFGCDRCQEVCPFNSAPNAHSPLPEFSEDAGVGPLLSLKELFTLKTEEQFRARFRDTALLRTGRSGLLRNACAVAANTGAESVIPEIFGLLTDGAETVRASAMGALLRLDPVLTPSQRTRLRSFIERAHVES